MDWFDLCEDRLRALIEKDPAAARDSVNAILLRLIRFQRESSEVRAVSETAPPYESDRTQDWLNYFRRRYDLSVAALAKALRLRPSVIYGWKTRERISLRRRKQLKKLVKRLENRRP